MLSFIATCGPTGIGKTFQMQRLMTQEPARFTSVLSVTTRASRGTADDAWYRFVTRDEIQQFDPQDIISNVEFRGERYLLLRSEIERALQRAPVAFMAIVPSVILLMRERGIRHSILNCRVGDVGVYTQRLQQRGYFADALTREIETGTHFVYPPPQQGWPERNVFLGRSDGEDNAAFDRAVAELISDPPS